MAQHQTKEYRAAWYQANKEKHNAKQKEYRKRVGPQPQYNKKYKETQRELYLYKMAKTRAKKRGLEFTIEKEDIIIPDYCPYFNEKLIFDAVGYHPYSPSIDRIDSTKGYIKGNIEVISSQANRMKWDATQEQLLTFAQGVLEKAGRAFANKC